MRPRTPEPHTLSLHDALPIFAAARARSWPIARRLAYGAAAPLIPLVRMRRILAQVPRDRRRATLPSGTLPAMLFLLMCDRSEEHTSELQSQFHVVCRLLLEKK